MTKRRFFTRLISVLAIITGIFGYIYMEDFVDFIRANKLDQTEESTTLEVEELDKDYVYYKDEKIVCLHKDNLVWLNWDGEEIHRRVMPTETYKMMGVNNLLFVFDNVSKKMDILDMENHLLGKEEGFDSIDGVKEMKEGYALFLEDGINFVTQIFKDPNTEVLSISSKDASVDLNKSKNGYKFLSLSRNQNGLNTVLSLVNDMKETKKLLVIDGHIPYALLSTKKGDFIVTDKQLVFWKDDKVEMNINYDKFNGFCKLDENYCLLSDYKLKILDDFGKILLEEEVPGFDHITKVANKAVIYSGRLYYVIGDDGIIKKVETKKDIKRIHGDVVPVVEHSSGFTMYK